MPGYELVGREELQQIEDIFNHGAVLFRHGFESKRQGRFKVQEFESAFKSRFNFTNALAVSSGTAALKIGLKSLGIGPGDEVILPCFTFVASAEAVIECGALPIFVDVDESLNICPESATAKIGERTKAIMAVHMLGVAANLAQLRELCSLHNLFLVEDVAWGCGGSYHEEYLGSFGDVAAFSFDFAKTITTGEGGMVVCKDPVIAKKAAAWHDHGHLNIPTLPRWEDRREGTGFNFRMSELQGAVGLAQLVKLDFILEQQRLMCERLGSVLANCSVDLKLRPFPIGSVPTGDGFVFFMPSAELALNLRERLAVHGVATKILPEAMTWHFAGFWEHLRVLSEGAAANVVPSGLERSELLLSRAVCLPTSVIDDAVSAPLQASLDEVFSSL